MRLARRLFYTGDSSLSKVRNQSVKTILVFDKYPNMLEAFNRFLSQENYRVLTAERLEEALMIIEVMGVDLMIMDTGKNSEVSVLESLRVIRKKNLSLPIILTATHSDTLAETVAKELGFADLVLKPFDPEDIKRVVKRLVHKDQLSFS
ncbi:MAG: response regulator [Pseudomonadota bacterium]